MARAGLHRLPPVAASAVPPGDFPVPLPPGGAVRAPPLRGRSLAWIGSAGLHLAAGAALLVGLPARAPEPLPVMLLEMPAPEPATPAQPVPEMMAEAAPEPPPAPAEPPPPEPPPMAEAPPEPPPVAEAPPEPPPPLAEAPPPEPPPPEPAPEPPAATAALPLPPPPPVPAPALRRPAPHRPAVAQAPAMPSAGPPATSPAPAAPPAAPATAAAPPPNYVAQLFAALERHKTYPQEARYRRVQGVAMLRFRMRRDGTVTGYRLERSAGDAALDEAVLTMIQRASPLPAPPAEFAGESIELTVPVRFALR